MNIDNVYRLGLWIQRFKDSKNILPIVKGEGQLLYGLKLVQEFLEENNMGCQSIFEISEWKKKLESKYEDNTRIEEKDAVQLVLEASGWNKEIHTDLMRKYVMEITESGLSPNELLKLASSEPNKFIQEELYVKLTDIEKSDFSDAANCLLFGSATPSVMVMLRGAEACIRDFYFHKTGNEPGKKSWRQLIRELKRQAPTLSIEETFIGYLDYIGKEKRNFAQHPNKAYSLREATMIFMQVLAMVEDVYSYMRS